MEAIFFSTLLMGAVAMPAGVDEHVSSFPTTLVGTWEGTSSTWYRNEGLPGSHPDEYPIRIELYPQEGGAGECVPTEFGASFPDIDASWCEANCLDGAGNLAPSCDPEEESPLCECGGAWNLVWEEAGMIYYPSFGMNAVLRHVFPVSCDITYAGGEEPVTHSCFELVEDYYDERSVGYGWPCNQFSYVTVALQADGSLYWAWYQGGVAPLIATLNKVENPLPLDSNKGHGPRPDLDRLRRDAGFKALAKATDEQWPPLFFDPPQPGQNYTGESPEDLVLPFNGWFNGVASNLFPPNEKHGFYSGETYNVTYGPFDNCSSFTEYGVCGEGVFVSETDRSFNAPTWSILNIFCENHWEGPDPVGTCWTYEHFTPNQFPVWKPGAADQEFGTFSLQRDGSVWWTRMLGPLVFDQALLQPQP
jgi:hypothetical protein